MEQITQDLGLAICFPYDLVYDDVHDILISTWKERADGYFTPSPGKVRNAFIKIALRNNGPFAYQVIPHDKRSIPDDLIAVPSISTAFGIVQSVDPSADHAYFSLDYEGDGFALNDWTPVPSEANAIYFDPEQSEIYVMLYHKYLRVYGWPGNRFLRSIRIPGDRNILWMEVLEDRHLAYFSVAGSGFSEVDLQTGDARISKRFLPIKSHVYDPITDSFFVSGMMEHGLWEVDRKTLTFQKLHPIGFCAHFLYLDPERRILYVGDYSDGGLSAFSLDEKRVLARLSTGTLLRNMAFSSNRDRLFFASGCGIYEVDLEAWLGKGKVSITH